MKLRFESTLHRGQQPTLINSSQRVQILPFQSMSYKVYLLSTFDGAVNAELSFMYRQLTSRTVMEVRQKTTTLQPRLLLTGKLHREWSVQLWNEGLFWRSRYSQTNFYLVDASVRYRPVEKPWEVELVGQNLLNTRYYFTTSLNAVYLDESSYRLQPRYVALRMNWRF
ncbi:hypothetical protein BWI93_25105 [Siphonobacter sp. BAB-5385]|uniref:TonB-dependent receptor n=1 Tax=Siphonobacter sp. BAB-5385 TaxID=1864822 RepID=UPI000B9EE7F7|nr:TonB-dependent receptor [Siphonobacter sp. BAB-5385]OZI05507.1 hypothetical protein BWI93_25105 [Siphonobacter sp. BAB-5385]